ncbi:MAG TPA: helix-turn-helix transcriptional regulator [Myxococcota bacterium]|nr:helix-turn-helix transcriptional regulator [Myxococcota bacterium]
MADTAPSAANRAVAPALVLLDRDGTILAATAAATTRLGQCVGKACWDVVGGLDEERRPICSPGCTTRVEEGETSASDAFVRGDRRRLECSRADDFVIVVMSDAPAREGPALTPRETQVLELAATGSSARESAEELGIGVATVRSHIVNARRKLGARTVVQAVARALVQGDIIIR